jgi:hypothetical protein
VTKANTNIGAKPASRITPEHELDLLAEIYRFILQCGEEKSAAGVTSADGDEAKGSEHEARPTDIIQG